MGKTRDLFKKIRDTKGTLHAKMGSIKDRNGMDLTEAEDIKKRWQEYTEELYKKELHDTDNHNGVITHLESGILDCVEHNKLWKILQEMGITDHLTCLLRNLYAGQEETELDREQETGSKWGKEYVKAVYCHPAYLIYMQST